MQMRFLRRIVGFLGFAKDDGGHEVKNQQEAEEEDNCHVHEQARSSSNFQETGLPRKGFSVPVQVAIDRPQLAPVLTLCSSLNGGVQGLKWYTKRLRIDEDGDVADEFLHEVLPETSSGADDQHMPLPRFEVNYRTRLAEIKYPVMLHDGKIQVEYQGRLQWV